jgi:glycosyltransferase involved in cell wall biosynthesis
MKAGNEFRVCIVVPHYNHAQALSQFLPKLVALELPIIVVDDGSDKQQGVQLQSALANYASATLCSHHKNLGKGVAMYTGAKQAIALGYTHMLQIDADGQHDISDIPKFIAAAKIYPTAIISGAPQFDESAPKARVYGRRITDFWVALETWSWQIKDSLCGFRIYPLAEFHAACRRYKIGPRMDFDTDILVKSVWMGMTPKFIDTNVVYVAGNVSHFHYLRDNLRLIWLHFRLMVGMLLRAPWWILKAWKSRFLHKPNQVVIDDRRQTKKPRDTNGG